jgi:hypothetical protein
MFGSKLLVAMGVLVISAGSAMAQFGHPGQFGGFPGYQSPGGGIVTKQAISNPFTGDTVINKSYVNPYTGVQAQKQIFIPGGGGPVFSNPAFGGLPAQLIPQGPQFGPNPFIRPVPVFVQQQPLFIQQQPFGGVNLNVQRPGFGVNLNFNNLFR